VVKKPGHISRTYELSSDYLARHRLFKKWMVQCPGCREWGIEPVALQQAWYRRGMEHKLKVFDLAANGLCEQCARAVQSRHSEE
jgi:hypothetical protein